MPWPCTTACCASSTAYLRFKVSSSIWVESLLVMEDMVNEKGNVNVKVNMGRLAERVLPFYVFFGGHVVVGWRGAREVEIVKFGDLMKESQFRTQNLQAQVTCIGIDYRNRQKTPFLTWIITIWHFRINGFTQLWQFCSVACLQLRGICIAGGKLLMGLIFPEFCNVSAADYAIQHSLRPISVFRCYVWTVASISHCNWTSRPSRSMVDFQRLQPSSCCVEGLFLAQRPQWCGLCYLPGGIYLCQGVWIFMSYSESFCWLGRSTTGPRPLCSAWYLHPLSDCNSSSANWLRPACQHKPSCCTGAICWIQPCYWCSWMGSTDACVVWIPTSSSIICGALHPHSYVGS